MRKQGSFALARRAGWFAVVCALALLFSIGLAYAANPSGFETANQLYDQGKFAEAKKAYVEIANTHNYSANLFDNLGNAEDRLGNLAGAIVACERWRALEPAHG